MSAPRGAHEIPRDRASNSLKFVAVRAITDPQIVRSADSQDDGTRTSARKQSSHFITRPRSSR